MEGLPFGFGNHSDKGLVREVNQDAMAYYAVAGGHLMMVADGMGGHAAGEAASQIALEVIYHYFQHQPIQEPIDQYIIHAIELANRSIFQYAQNHVEKLGMGTTLVLAFFQDNVVTIAHVGDSRAYCYHPDQGLQCLTKDHSFVQELVNQGIITEEEAFYHPRKNEITRALGTHPSVAVDIQQRTVKPNEIYLLLTDGISSLLTSQQIQAIVSSDDTPQQIAEKLVQAANDLGGYDNSTVQVISFKQVLPQDLKNPENSEQKQGENFAVNQDKSNQDKPKSETKDSSLRYYLFIGGAVITIALLLYYAFSAIPETHLVPQDVASAQVMLSSHDSLTENTSLIKNQVQENLKIQYKVKQGDKLIKLANSFNYPVDSIKKINNLQSDVLKPNQVLEFPIQAIHEVAKGENLTIVAQKYEVKINDIRKINGLSKNERLKEGQKLYIPLKENNN
jgi:protein phosphatase